MTTEVSTPRKTKFRLRLEPRLNEPPKWFPLAVSFGAIVVALILGGILITAAGGDALKSYAHIADASFGDIGVLSDTIVKATPILLTALACSVAFRMKQWNIGAEGQFIMGEIPVKGEADQEMVDKIGMMMTGTPLEKIKAGAR